jgi:hypothetical protein
VLKGISGFGGTFVPEWEQRGMGQQPFEAGPAVYGRRDHPAGTGGHARHVRRGGYGMMSAVADVERTERNAGVMGGGIVNRRMGKETDHESDKNDKRPPFHGPTIKKVSILVNVKFKFEIACCFPVQCDDGCS